MDRITESFSVRLSVLYDTGNELTDVAMFRDIFFIVTLFFQLERIKADTIMLNFRCYSVVSLLFISFAETKNATM